MSGLDDDRVALPLGLGSIHRPWPLVAYLGSSMATIFGYRVYESNAPAWTKLAYRVAYAIRRARLWVEYRVLPSQRMHVVPTGLRPGYHDPDERMLHAMMALLGVYVTDRYGDADEMKRRVADVLGAETFTGGDGEREVVERWSAMETEALAIWLWWTISRPALEQEIDDLLSALYGGRPIQTLAVPGTDLVAEVLPEADPEHVHERQRLWDLEDRLESETTAMLHRLVDIRGGLWT